MSHIMVVAEAAVGSLGRSCCARATVGSGGSTPLSRGAGRACRLERGGGHKAAAHGWRPAGSQRSREKEAVAAPPRAATYQVSMVTLGELLAEAYGEGHGQLDFAAHGAHTFSAADWEIMERLSDQGEHSYTYGEASRPEHILATRMLVCSVRITVEGTSQLGELLGVGSADTFYDLGSGYGRLVVQAHLEWNVKKSVGVELSMDRHAKAMEAAGKLKPYLDPSRPMELVHGNLLTLDVSDATCVYMATTCWDHAFMSEVLAKIEAECPELKWLVSTEDLHRKWGLQPEFLTLLGMERVGQTWAPEGYPVYIYCLTPRRHLVTGV